MTIRAISIVEPVIGLIMRGDVTALWRNGVQMAGLAIGECLWVREPFYLERKFNGIAPSVARDRGAKPWFAADLKEAPDPDSWLGRRRMARELPRAWHRQHLQVTDIDMRELQSVTEPEAKAMGYTCVAHFARGWDANLMFSRHAPSWQDNPTVTAFTFDRIEGPAQ
jgi:hypothetical protein